MFKYSQAYREFQELLAVSRELLKLERRLKEPPVSSQARQSNGLKGGAAVLMVAAFEGFIQDVVAERLGHIAAKIPYIDACDLHEAVWLHQVFESLNRAMKGHPLAPPPPMKRDRLPNVYLASRSILNGNLDPRIFCDTMGNPNPKNLRLLFKNIGVSDILEKVKPQFDIRWKSPTAATFVEDKLQEIIDLRNRVAHGANMRGIARRDLAEAVRFLEVLSAVIDQELARHINQMLRSVPRRSRPLI